MRGSCRPAQARDGRGRAICATAPHRLLEHRHQRVVFHEYVIRILCRDRAVAAVGAQQSRSPSSVPRAGTGARILHPCCPAAGRERTRCTGSLRELASTASGLPSRRARNTSEAFARSRAAKPRDQRDGGGARVRGPLRLEACRELRLALQDRCRRRAFFRLFAARVAPVVVMSTIASAVPAAGAPSVAPALSTMR